MFFEVKVDLGLEGASLVRTKNLGLLAAEVLGVLGETAFSFVRVTARITSEFS